MTLRSMTAYGRACCPTPFGRLTVEIQSVNRRHLEISCFLPREWLGLDAEIKERLSKEIQRGHVTVTLNAAYERESPITVTPNLALVAQLKTAWEKIAATVNTPLQSTQLLELLAKERDLFLYEGNMKDHSALQEALDQCLAQLIEMKKKEGLRLLADILPRFQLMQEAIRQIRQRAPNAIEKYRNKLKARLEEILSGSVENEEKILREVSVYAEKVDITEEITRFESHLKQALELFNSDVPSVGKTCEFLLQELNREINTIASKAADAEVARLVIAVKAELERIREQIQNVE